MAQEEFSAALAVYGSLAPGESHHWVVSRIAGEWIQGRVQGHVFEVTWGPAQGYQGFIPDPDGAEVVVWVLQSSQLEKKWREIDDFQGPGYARVDVKVQLVDASSSDDGEAVAHQVEAQIYVALTEVD